MCICLVKNRVKYLEQGQSLYHICYDTLQLGDWLQSSKISELKGVQVGPRQGSKSLCSMCICLVKNRVKYLEQGQSLYHICYNTLQLGDWLQSSKISELKGVQVGPQQGSKSLCSMCICLVKNRVKYLEQGQSLYHICYDTLQLGDWLQSSKISELKGVQVGPQQGSKSLCSMCICLVKNRVKYLEQGQSLDFATQAPYL